ncbi:AAA family ATPase [Acanthopleuribacter pedis]|uniref:AAA family ATPase n=1 Tax=Acanthopleuribacter pedis TaxID=442870 RepID=A0A8J7QI29_9BACT|nr:AAA family ATPase [Acanthopleuribacter pedis]
MISANSFYFLSRPRRFGKSLLLSTLKALFGGRRELFEGLAISKTDYTFPTHPVVHLDLSAGRVSNRGEFEKILIQKVQDWVEEHNADFQVTNESPRACLKQLIQFLAKKGQVVLLIDEYDKPILDHLDDLEMAKMVREVLKDFYSVVKEQSDNLRFVMVTGVSKFSKVSLFSGLNNLVDISNIRDYADLLGFTQSELDANFGPHMEVMATELDLSLEEVKDNLRIWYNGYRFSDKHIYVYNPVSVMRALSERRFANFWFETATPTMLIKLIREDQRFRIEDIGEEIGGHIAFDTFDLEALQLNALLFQTGYLTIAESVGRIERTYRLDFPNYEVRKSLFTYLIEDLTRINRGFSAGPLIRCARALTALDRDEFERVLKQDLFANIPYTLQMPYERYYQSLFHMLFVLLGLEIHAEVPTNRGRIDHLLKTEQHIFIFEMKFLRAASEAIQQIKDKRYPSGFASDGRQVVLVGMSFEDSGLREVLFELVPQQTK